ncbi:MAG: hypothetical protein UZ07_CHB004001551 [Chlorobi bacterium OLB7]|nr:MAG: hypothetical protein UZ07_CHB004001551 [Chlorobi bacterium OLB7]
MIEGAINKITEPFGSCRGTYCYLQRGGIIGQIGFRLEAIYKPHNGRQGVGSLVLDTPTSNGERQ